MLDSMSAGESRTRRIMTRIGDDHLHDECKMMTIKDHCNMHSKQFHLATAQDDYPTSKAAATNPSRLIRNTLVFGIWRRNQ